MRQIQLGSAGKIGSTLTLVVIFLMWPILCGATSVEQEKAVSETETLIAKNGHAQAVIVIGKDSGPFYGWLAEEMQRYLKQLSSAEVPIVTSSEVPKGKPLIVLGGAEVNPLSSAAQRSQLVDFSGLKAEGFVLKSVKIEGQPALIVGGRDEAGSMYAVYEVLERLGIVFQLTNDIIPEQKVNLALPVLDMRTGPMAKYRGILIDPGFCTWYMGLEDYRKLIDQMAKLKLNRFEFFIGIGSPWLKFSHNGQVGELTGTPETGYLAWGLTSRSWGKSTHSTTATGKDVRVGRDVFPQEYVGAPEFADVRTPAEAFRTAHEFLQELIRYAHRRHIQVSLMLGELSFVPPNLAPASVKSPGGPLSGDIARWMYQRYCGIALSPGDPLVLDIWEAAMRGLIESYPEADSYGFWNTEHSPDLREPRVAEILSRYADVRAKLPSVAEIRRRGYVTVNSPEDLDSDFLQMYLAAQVVQRVKKYYPMAKLGIMSLFRGYTLAVMDTMVPKDVWLGNMENNNTTGPVMDFYGGISGRDLIAYPRITDDGDELHMQVNATEFDQDEIITGAEKYGLAGIMGQVMHLRNAEYTTRYMAEGAWNPQIRPRSFYESYLSHIYGRDALDPLLQAFLLLEENEKAMVYWGRSEIFLNFADFSPLKNLRTNVNYWEAKPTVTLEGSGQSTAGDRPPNKGTAELDRQELLRAINATWGMSSFWKARQAVAPQHAKAVAGTEGQHYDNRAAQCRQALELLRQARPKVLHGSRAELDYVIYKTEHLITYLDVLSASYDATVALDRAWLGLVDGDWAEFGTRLNQSQEILDGADRLARAAAGQMIAYSDTPTEKYLLLRFNRNVIASIERSREYVSKVIKFHDDESR